MATSLAVRLTPLHMELLCLQQSRSRLRVTGTLTIPATPATADAGTETARVKKQVTTFLKQNSIRNGQVFVSLPREEVVLREITLPLVVEENLAQVLTYELDRYTPFAKDEAYFSYQVMTRNAENNTLTMLFCAVEHARLQRYRTRMTAVGLTPTAIEVTSTAMLRSLSGPEVARTASPSGTAPLRAMVEVHEAGFELILAEGPLLRYARSVPKVDDVLRSIEVELDKAILSMKRHRNQILDITLSQTVVHRDHILAETLEAHVGIPTRLADPFASESMALIGLGLRGLDQKAGPINLLPQDTAPHSPRRRYAPTVALLTLAIGLAIGYLALAFMNDRKTLNDVNEKLQAFSPAIATMTRLQDQTSTIQKQIQTLQSLMSNQHGALDILKEVTTVVPDQNWLTNLTYKGHSISLTGKANSSPAHLISLLEHSSVFYDVNFTEPVNGQEFRIQARIHTPASTEVTEVTEVTDTP